jgi:hypothetical protein
VIAAVVKAALHALTHTTISVKTRSGCTSRCRYRDHRPLRLRAQRRAIAIAAALFNRHADPKKRKLSPQAHTQYARASRSGRRDA